MERTEHNWHNGEVVEYDNGMMKGIGKVVGVAAAPCAVIGASMIIEDLSYNVPSNDYPFSHFTVFEVHLKRIP